MRQVAHFCRPISEVCLGCAVVVAQGVIEAVSVYQDRTSREYTPYAWEIYARYRQLN